MTDGISSQLYGPLRIQPSADQQEFRSTVKSLIDAIKSGDVDSAKKAYAKLEETSSGKGQSDSNSPFAQLLSQIGDALDAGAIDAAKSALTAFEEKRHAGPPPGAGPRPGGPSEAERSAFSSLIDALKSDNLDSAKTAYADLLKAREDKNNNGSGQSPIDSFLNQIGTALSNDDLDSAQAALEQLAQHHPQGGAVDVSA